MPIIAVVDETFSLPDVESFKFSDEVVKISVGAIASLKIWRWKIFLGEHI